MRHFVGLIAILGSTACTGTLDSSGPGGPDPTSNEVSVVVRDGSVAAPGVTVIFQNTDDSVISETTTDGAGTATAEMTTGNVTVIRHFPAPLTPDEQQRPPELYTYVGVKGGDVLELGDPTPADDAPASAINVMVPSTANGTVTVETPCGTGSGQAPLIPLTVRGCGSNLVLYVTDGDNSSFVASAPYGENVDVSNHAFLGSLGTTISATNVQPDTQIQVEKRLVKDDFTLFSTGTKRIDQTPATVDVPDLLEVDELQLVALTDANGRTQRKATRQPYVKGLTTIDGGVLGMIPYVSNVDYSPTGISWVEAGPAAGQADSVITVLTVSRDLGGAAPGPDDVYVHAIIAPHNGATMRMPFLPTSAANFNPGATDNIQGRFGLVQVTGTAEGYDALRNLAFRHASVLDAAPAGGQVVLSYQGNTPPTL